MKTKFLNPYIETPDCQVIANIGRSDFNTIRTIRPVTGTTTGVIGHLWQKLAHELRQRNITDISQVEQFEDFIANCHIISDDEYRRSGLGLPNGAVSGTLQNTVPPDDARATVATDNASAAAATEPSNVQSGSGSGVVRRSAKAKKGQVVG